MDAIAWYNEIALKNGGYQSDARYTVRGISGENVFRERLLALLPTCGDVLDAGCGHGAFTQEMAKHTRRICAFDFAVEMVRAANCLKAETGAENVQFLCATTKEPLPYRDGQFDLIYSRRGPASILDHPRLLKEGGAVLGIHGEGLSLDDLEQRAKANGFAELEVSTYPDAWLCFPTAGDFASYLSASHLNPDYRLPEHQEAFSALLRAHTVNGEILLRQIRHVWSAKKL